MVRLRSRASDRRARNSGRERKSWQRRALGEMLQPGVEIEGAGCGREHPFLRYHGENSVSMNFGKADLRHCRHFEHYRRITRTFAQLRVPVLVEDAVDLLLRHSDSTSEF